jgi:hypothetical protein
MLSQQLIAFKWIRILLIGVLAVLIATAASIGTYLFLHKNNIVNENNKTTEIYSEPLWKELYAIELRKHMDAVSPMFNLYDLDGDGVPELLISDDNYHAAAGEIYTVYHEKPIKLGSCGSWGEFQYCSDTKYIFSGMTAQGCTSSSVYKIENGKMIERISFFDNTGYSGESGLVFEVNGKEVSQEDFDNEQEKYGEVDSEYPFVRKYDVTEREIMRVLDLQWGWTSYDGGFLRQYTLWSLISNENP